MLVVNADVRRIVVEFCTLREMLGVRAVSSEWRAACEEWATYLLPSAPDGAVKVLYTSAWTRAVAAWIGSDQKKRASSTERCCIALIGSASRFHRLVCSTALVGVMQTDHRRLQKLCGHVEVVMYDAGEGTLVVNNLLVTLVAVPIRIFDMRLCTRDQLVHLDRTEETMPPPVLKKLMLSASVLPECTGKLRSLLVACRFLTALDVSGPRREDEMMSITDVLAAVAVASDLEVLVLSYWNVIWSGEGRVPRLRRLRALRLTDCVCDRSLVPLLVACPNLTALDVLGEAAMDGAFTGAVGSLSHLNVLCFSHGAWSSTYNTGNDVLPYATRSFTGLALSPAGKSIVRLDLLHNPNLDVADLADVLGRASLFPNLALLRLSRDRDEQGDGEGPDDSGTSAAEERIVLAMRSRGAELHFVSTAERSRPDDRLPDRVIFLTK